MKFRKLPTLTLAAAGFAALAIGPDARACEQSLPDPHNGGCVCWSGFSSGGQTCTGGFGEPCNLEGSCSDPSVGEGCDPNATYCESEAWEDYDNWVCLFWCHC